MKNLRSLITSLFLGMLLASCVAVTPATNSYPVTGDLLRVWLDGIPYDFFDENQHYQALLEEGSSDKDHLYIDVDKKGNWVVVTGEQVAKAGEATTEVSATRKKVMLKDIHFVKRASRK